MPFRLATETAFTASFVFSSGCVRKAALDSSKLVANRNAVDRTD